MSIQLIKVKKRLSEGNLISAIKKSKSTLLINIDQEEQKNDFTKIEIN
jgi:hypothetical protein